MRECLLHFLVLFKSASNPCIIDKLTEVWYYSCVKLCGVLLYRSYP